jgi:hypothetical protein
MVRGYLKALGIVVPAGETSNHLRSRLVVGHSTGRAALSDEQLVYPRREVRPPVRRLQHTTPMPSQWAREPEIPSSSVTVLTTS